LLEGGPFFASASAQWAESRPEGKLAGELAEGEPKMAANYSRGSFLRRLERVCVSGELVWRRRKRREEKEREEKKGKRFVTKKVS